MENYEDDIHNATNPQLADLLDEIANKAESGLKQMELDNEVLEIIKQEIEIMREAAKRLRTKQRELFNSEGFSI